MPPPGRHDRPRQRSSRKAPRHARDLVRALRIVHEDDDVIVVDKPPGLLSATPPGAKDVSVFGLMKERAREQSSRGQAWIIHRLDRDASGLIVFARSERAFNWLKEDFRARRVDRTYLALVEGEMPRQGDQLPSGTIQSFLREDRFGVVRSVPAARGPGAPRPEADEARLAVTYWKALATGQGRTLVELRMESGRKHQIRVHLADLGHPVAGDERYGARTDPLGRVALHAAVLGFRHPGTGTQVSFRSNVPARWWTSAGAAPPPETAAPPRPPEVPRPARPRSPDKLETGWDRVANWYDQLIDEQRSDHYEGVILPGALRLLAPTPGLKVLDVACGQGDFCRRLAALRVEATGLDSSPRLIEAARRHGAPRGPDRAPIRFEIGDAREIPKLGLGPFDAATCLMALMNMDPLDPVIRGIAQVLEPGGAFVGVILHPAFRAPRQTSWGVDPNERPHRRFRRVDGYLSPGQFEIVMNPGEAAAGKPPITTWTFHRPLQAYFKALGDAGFAVEAFEEWPTQRPAPGGRISAEENRVRREIPLFIGFRARRGDRAAR